MASPEMTIGLARLSDAPQIARMSRDLIEDGLEWSWTAGRVTGSIRSATALVVVARDGNAIAGFGLMRYGDDDAHLDLFCVAPAYRRRGLGRRLIEWLEKVALVAGIVSVFLEVRAANAGAQAFYQQLGYRKLSVLPRYYQGVESAVRMGRELGQHSRAAVR